MPQLGQTKPRGQTAKMAEVSLTAETLVTAVVATAVGSSSAIEVGSCRRDHECKAMRVGFTSVRRYSSGSPV